MDRESRIHPKTFWQRESVGGVQRVARQSTGWMKLRIKFAGDAVSDLDNLFGRTGPAYSRLDLRLDSRINYRRYSMNSFVTVANVLGRKNRFGRFWDPGRQDVIWFEGFGIFPVGGVAVSF